MAIRVKKVTMNPAYIMGMFATPQIVLPAPAAGYINNILGVSHDMVYNSAAYTVAAAIRYGSTGPGIRYVFFDNVILASTVDSNMPIQKFSATLTSFSTTKDFYVTTDAAAATGDSTITAYIIYETKLIDV